MATILTGIILHYYNNRKSINRKEGISFSSNAVLNFMHLFDFNTIQ